MKHILAQFNKYPFFLFLTYKKEAQLDLDNMKITTDVRSSMIEPVPTWQVCLIKYVPLLFVLYWSKYPTSKIEGFVAFLGIAYTLSYIWLWKRNMTLAKVIFFISLAIIYYMRFKVSLHAIYINWFIIYSMMGVVLYYLFYDVYHERYKNYYLLLERATDKRIQLTTRKPRPLIMIPFLSRVTKSGREGVFYVKQGLNIGFNVFLRGFFVRIVKTLEEKTDETL